jgi:hypothetical protein
VGFSNITSENLKMQSLFKSDLKLFLNLSF